MKRTSSSEHGFAAVETILIIIILAIIGLTGWYVWHSKQNADKTLNTASQTTKNDTVAPQTSYLTVKEWSVKIPLSTDIKDAYYVYNQQNDTVYLSKDSYKGTNCAADQTTLGALGRFTADQKDAMNGQLMTSLYPNAVKIGTYYYYYVHPQAACDGAKTDSTATFDSAKASVASGQMDNFKQAVAHIMSVQ
ncbi:MAG TPA: hypothetical protein VHD60_04500 [Candidatus Saccharimonadales bacterium]|nr:hypothetical protein [Candidatus Saccharimonadales bacterium]